MASPLTKVNSKTHTLYQRAPGSKPRSIRQWRKATSTWLLAPSSMMRNLPTISIRRRWCICTAVPSARASRVMSS